MKINLNTTPHSDIRGNCVLPNLLQHFGEDTFMLEHDDTLVHNAKSAEELITESGV